MFFLLIYIVAIIRFQITNEFTSGGSLLVMILGLLSGFTLMIIFFFIYLKFTNKDIFQIITSTVEKKLKSVPLTRGNILDLYKKELRSEIRVDNYLEFNLKSNNIRENPVLFRKEAILKVFGQNHLNLVLLELGTLLVLLILGVFRENIYFQIPAAASAILLLTVIMILTGAITYWVRKWALTAVILLFILLNYLIGEGILSSEYKAYGLNYESGLSDYSLRSLDELTTDNYQQDIDSTHIILKNWRSKFSSKEKPKIVFICTSGGGQRSALWTFTAMQVADSLTRGKLMDHTILITGASGGMIGAAYYRELVLRDLEKQTFNHFSHRYRKNISSDNLNPIIFSLVVNDLFYRYQTFQYNNLTYFKDRGYAFEQALNTNTMGIMDKPISEYRIPEQKALIPMILIAPTVINDSRRLYISPQPISFLNIGDLTGHKRLNQKIKGIEFRRLFASQGAENLRFLSALRMGATFPYISPNISLPTEPTMQIMDAGITDMYGISDATRFISVFKDWINEHTSGVLLLSIRDSEKIMLVEENIGESLIDKMTNPVTRLYSNIGSSHDIRNDSMLESAASWLNGKLEVVELQYISGPANRAALNWRLTTLEKQDIISNIKHPKNQKSLIKLQKLLN
jgi:hypothetical protein